MRDCSQSQVVGSPANLLDLQRKLEKKIDERKTIQLSPEELDLIVECGAYDAVVKAALDFRKAEVRMRRAPASQVADQTTE